MMTMTDDQISAGEASAILGVCVQTIRRYALTGRVPYTRLPGGHYRFDRQDVIALRTLAPPAPAEPGRPPKFGALEVTP